jgi:hypothetical protein
LHQPSKYGEWRVVPFTGAGNMQIAVFSSRIPTSFDLPQHYLFRSNPAPFFIFVKFIAQPSNQHVS